ncbi:MAG: hypothetical protein M3R54_00620 [Chloroflexota bacterium]|nr:hypothetical protein [Chloroflexota bacterium]
MQAEGIWSVRGGTPRRKSRPKRGLGSVESLSYNNPYGYNIERVWFDAKIIYASEQGEVDIDETKVKVAQEYQIVYSVSLNARGHWVRGTRPRRVPGQLNIYDTVPGMRGYSPIWQFNYVIVPRGYKANTLRSEKDCLGSGYPIKKSRIFEN